MIARYRRVVVDACMVVELLLRRESGRRLEQLIGQPDTNLWVPSLCDVEVAAALRRLALVGKIGEVHLAKALEVYRDLPMVRSLPLHQLDRVLELRHNFSAYDAVYVALAEGLGAELCTGDARLAKAVEAHTAVPLV